MHEIYDSESACESDSEFSYNKKRTKTKSLSRSKAEKQRKCRTTFSQIQIKLLEEQFLISCFIHSDRLNSLSESTGLEKRIIKVID